MIFAFKNEGFEDFLIFLKNVESDLLEFGVNSSDFFEGVFDGENGIGKWVLEGVHDFQIGRFEELLFGYFDADVIDGMNGSDVIVQSPIVKIIDVLREFDFEVLVFVLDVL